MLEHSQTDDPIEPAPRLDSDSAGHRVTESLDSIGIRHGIDQSSKAHNYLQIYQAELGKNPHSLGNIAILSAKNSIETARTFSEFFPDSHISLFQVGKEALRPSEMHGSSISVYPCSTIVDVVNTFESMPRPNVIIEDGSNRKASKLEYFRRLFLFLEDEGQYVVEDLHAKYITGLIDSPGEDIGDYIARLMDSKLLGSKALVTSHPDERWLAEGIQSFLTYGKIAFVKKSGHHYLKLRDTAATAVLTARFGTEWGTELLTLPGRKFQSMAHVTSNRDDLMPRFKQEIDLPELHLRRYDGVTCYPQQISVMGDYLLPDSFRHSRAHRLSNTGTQDASPSFAKLPKAEVVHELQGVYFYLDTEYPGHFGHVSTEVIARLWGWREAILKYPEIRALVSLKKDQLSIPSFQLDLFAAFGIDEEKISYIPHDSKCYVEHLIAATPQFSNPHWVDPEISAVWREIGASIADSSAMTHSKIFVSRKQEAVRSCNNTAEVEALFSHHGFKVIFPEKMSIQEQVQLFAKADVIAGFGGSGLFNMMYSESPGTRIILAGETYIAMNEYLISAALGDSIHYFWCASDKSYPPGRWTAEAFRSNFTFDFTRDGAALDELLSAL